MKQRNDTAHYIIRRIRLAHCKRGPSRCQKCREMDTPRLCLLDISPPHPGMEQRRVIGVSRNGEIHWHEFDVVKVFETEDKALAYAEKHAIGDIEL